MPNKKSKDERVLTIKTSDTKQCITVRRQTAIKSVYIASQCERITHCVEIFEASMLIYVGKQVKRKKSATQMEIFILATVSLIIGVRLHQ
jgi:hypothetical protein